MAKFYIGIDGGGSKTKFICFDSLGQECGSAVTLGSYWAQDGIDAVLDRLHDGVTQCLPETTEDVVIGFGVSGYGENRELDKLAVERICALFSPMRIHIDSDSITGWAGSLAMEPGVSVIAGTGSIAFGRDASGNIARCGGWHELFSDEGSGYWLGKQLLQIFSQQSDGRLEKTVLYDLVRNELALEDDFDIISYVNEHCVNSRKNTAALQMILLKAARLGDSHALACYDRASSELARLILTVIRELDFTSEKVSVSFQGGLFSLEDLILNSVAQKVANTSIHKQIKFCKPKLSPCHGSVLLAVSKLEPDSLDYLVSRFSDS